MVPALLTDREWHEALSQGRRAGNATLEHADGSTVAVQWGATTEVAAGRRLVALGASGPEIAAALHIGHDTVRTHVRNAMGKLGARSSAHLVAKAIGGSLVHV